MSMKFGGPSSGKKFNRKKQIVDVSLLPPCKENLALHIMRSNTVAYLFRRTDMLVTPHDDPENHGWDGEGKVTWSEEDISGYD